MRNPRNKKLAELYRVIGFIALLFCFVFYFFMANSSELEADPSRRSQVGAFQTTAPFQLPQTSWIGNSFSGREAWVPHNMDTLFVSPGGTAYSNTYWEEGTHEVTVFKDGKVIGGSNDLHGWGRGQGARGR